MEWRDIVALLHFINSVLKRCREYPECQSTLAVVSVSGRGDSCRVSVKDKWGTGTGMMM